MERESHLPKIRTTPDAERLGFGAGEYRQEHASKNRDDRDHHEELNQRECQPRSPDQIYSLISPGVNLAGPTLAGIATRAAATVKGPAYKGAAKDAQGYIRESIANPHAYLVPGPTYGAGGRSFMPDHYEKTLQPGQIEQLTAYLVTLQ